MRREREAAMVALIALALALVLVLVLTRVPALVPGIGDAFTLRLA